MVADMEVNKVADMEVDKVADMEVDKVADNVADIEVDKVADMVICVGHTACAAEGRERQSQAGHQLEVEARDPDYYRLYAVVWPCRRESGTSCGSVMVPAYDPILVINLPLQLSLWENLGTDDKDF